MADDRKPTTSTDSTNPYRDYPSYRVTFQVTKAGQPVGTPVTVNGSHSSTLHAGAPKIDVALVAVEPVNGGPNLSITLALD